MTIVFVFKNGFELEMQCEEFSIEKDALGNLKGWSAKEVKKNKPLYFDYSELLGIYRVAGDEVAE